MFIPSLGIGRRELAFVALVASPAGFDVIIKISVICGAIFTVEARKYLPLTGTTTHDIGFTMNVCFINSFKVCAMVEV